MAFITGPALPTRAARSSAVCNVRMAAEKDEPVKMTRRAALAAAVAMAAAAVVPEKALANREYANVGYLGGSEVIDINNANVRAYAKYKGFYPGLAGLIVANGPYKSVDELYALPGITENQKKTLDTFRENLVALDPAPEYEIDKFNNGLYR